MSTLLPNSNYKYCVFDSRFGTNIQYLCHKQERCCPPGCCVTFSVKKFELAVLWILLFSCTAFFYCISKYCNYLKKRNNARNLQPTVNGNLNLITSRRFQEIPYCSGTNKPELPPPKYNEAILMAKVIHPNNRVHIYDMKESTHISENNQNHLLPSYEAATNENTQQNGNV